MRYIPELDGLRAIAVVAVILYHSAARSPVPGGFVGVDLFFVLSAFLISGVLERQALRVFYARRLVRLMPALLLLLGVSMALWPLTSPGYPLLRDVALTAFYLSDYSFTWWNLPGHFGHTWSLAVEEHFYLVWPFIIPHLRRSKHPGRWLAAAYVILTLWRLPFAADVHQYYFRFDTHATGLVAGAWLYFVRPRISPPLAASAALLLGVIFAVGNIQAAFLFITPAEMASVIIIAWAVQQPSAVLACRPLVRVGQLSYAIYLWHALIAFSIRDQLGFAPTAVLTLTGSVAIAAISWAVVEAPARAWLRSARKDRDSPSGQVAAAAR